MHTDQPFQCLKFDMKGGAEDIEAETLTETLHSQQLCWVHLDYSEPSAVAWLESIDWLDPIMKSNLVDDNTRPRCFMVHNGLFLSLRGVNLNPGSDPEDMIAVRLWTNESCIITSNRRKLVSLEDLKQALANGTGPRSAAEFIRFLIEQLAFRAESVIEQMEDEFDALEDSLAQSEEAEHRVEISQMRRQAIRLRRFFTPQREALDHLLKDSPVWLGKTDKAHIRESINKFNRYVEELDSIRDRAVVAQEELLSKLSETLNQRMYTLSLVATLFLPLGFFTGLLGINVGGIPWADSSYGFLTICLIITAVVSGMIVYLKTKKWF